MLADAALALLPNVRYNGRMPSALMPRSEVVRRLAGVFRHHGYAGASLKLLSEATRLGRSSLYHYFPKGKEDMAAAVLADAEDWLRANLIAALKSEASPRARLEVAAQAITTFYEGGRLSCLLELFSAGEARALFGDKVVGSFRALSEALVRVAQDAGLPPAEAERRAEDTLIAIQGARVLARGLGDERPFVRVVAGLPDRMLGEGRA